MSRTRPLPEIAAPAAIDAALLTGGAHGDPHAVLGPHPVDGGTAVRALHPAAVAVSAVPGGTETPLQPVGDGLWSGLLPAGAADGTSYRLRFTFADGTTLQRDDPYRFGPTLGE